MTIQWGDTGRVAYGPLKTFNITLATPRETLLGTPLALQSTEPTSGQNGYVSLTIQQSDMPTITPSPISLKYTAILFVGGKNTDAASQSVSYHLYKNGTAVAAASSQTGIASNNFWTQQHARFFDVQVGDVLTVALYSPSANVNYDYSALMVMPTQMNLGKAYLNKDVNYSNYLQPTLTQGTASVQLNQSFNFYPSDTNSLNLQTAVNVNYGALRWNQSYYSGRVQMGDNNVTSATLTHATSRPYYARNTLPGTISFREILR